MPFANKKFHSRRDHHGRDHATSSPYVPHVPMGEQRFRQLLSELGAAFARADDGEERRRQAREREQQRQQWLERRQAVIGEIVALMQQHGLSVDDLA